MQNDESETSGIYDIIAVTHDTRRTNTARV